MTEILTDFYLPTDLDAASSYISNKGLFEGCRDDASQFRFSKFDVTNSNMNTSPTSSHSTASRMLTQQFYKTRMCPFHARGNCRNGSECTYAHGTAELKHAPDLFKTKLCDKWQSGNCSNTQCRYAHGRHELRYTDRVYKTRICHFWFSGDCNKGKLCRHAHGLAELHSLVTNYNLDLYSKINPENEIKFSNTVKPIDLASKFNSLKKSENTRIDLSATNNCLSLNNPNTQDINNLLFKSENTSIDQLQLPADFLTNKGCEWENETFTSDSLLVPPPNWYDKSQSCRVSEGYITNEGSPRHWTSSEPALSTSNSVLDIDLMQQLVDSINELTTEDKVQYPTISSEI